MERSELFRHSPIPSSLPPSLPQDLASLASAFAALDFHPGDAFLNLLVEACLGKNLEACGSEVHTCALSLPPSLFPSFPSSVCV